MATKKTELHEIKRDNGRPQPNSGRGSHNKADGILEPFCYDVKEYEKSYSISMSNWAKVATDAFKSGRRVPAIKIVLGMLGGKRIRLWVVEDSMFHEMHEAWTEKNGVERE